MNEKVVSDLRMMLTKKRDNGCEISLKSFTESLCEIKPDICYEEYCDLAIDFFERRRGYGDYVFIPKEFKWFVNNFVTQMNPNNVYVPYATGFECDLFTDTDVTYSFCNKENEQAIKMITEINTIDTIHPSVSFDLIVSALPLGPVNIKFVSSQIVESCISALSDNGYCIYTFAKVIASSSSERWLSELESKGLYCNAIIDMPMGAYAPLTMVDSEIVIFSKKKSEDIFTGLIGEEGLVNEIVSNFLNHKASTKGPKLGVYVNGDVKCFSDYLNDSRIKNKNKNLSKAYNGQSLKLSQLANVYAPDRNNEFVESDSAVYIPKLGNSPVVTDISDFHIKPQNYFQVVVNTDVILPRFLAFFLNTEEGMNIRQLSYKGVTIKAFNKKMLENLVIPCPSIELQSEYLKTNEELEVLRVQIETLKNRLQKTPAAYKNIRKEMKDINNNGDKFAQWIESLPYPIATILKRYSVADDADKKQETLFYFYEAYSIFEATLLSATMNKNLIDCSTLKDVDPSFFEKASFGNWVRMDRVLSNLFLGLVNNKDEEKKKIALACFKTSDENLIKLLCNKNVCNILDNACKYRNTWKGHSGITSDALYKEHVDILDSQLHKLQESIKDLYDRIRLIRPISLSFSNGMFSNKVEVLTGSNPIFTKDTIESLVPLDNSKLYLQIIDTSETIELPPYFILKNSPADAKNACYFYSRVESGSTRYVSYHYDGRPEDMEAGVVAFNHIKELLSNK